MTKKISQKYKDPRERGIDIKNCPFIWGIFNVFNI